MRVPRDLPARAVIGPVSEELQLRLDLQTPADPRPGPQTPSDPGPGSQTPPDRGPGPRPASDRTLTAEQLEAVARRREPLSLAAGAGSGKTSVLVERFARAVFEDRVAPERILAITFTERAAAELRERVRARLAELGSSEAAGAAAAHAEVGTFHGFCARLLRAHEREAGLGLAGEPFQILDEALCARLRRSAFTQALGQFLQGERADAVDLIAASGADRARTTVLATYAELRSRGQRSPRLPAVTLEASVDGAPADRTEEQGAAAALLWGELLERFGERYEEAKRKRGGVDFDDLELLAGELLAREPVVRSAWSERFELLMIDELQDVNPRQLALLKALERENLFTVGDRWQAIYGFRHADVSLFEGRERELAARGASLRLTRNFRGRPDLLAATNAVFGSRFGESFAPLVAAREPAARTPEAPALELLLSDRCGWEPAQRAGGAAVAWIDPAARAPAWRQAEAHALARRIGELIERGNAAPGEIVVLLRGTGDIDCYEHALRARGLDTLASAGAFWERQEVCDLLAYLRALVDPLDEVALYGVLASPFADLSSAGLSRISRSALAGGQSAWQTACELARGEDRQPAPDSALGRLAAICSWLSQERERAPELALSTLIGRALQQSGYGQRLTALPDGERRLANVAKLAELAALWERTEGRDLGGFLAEAAFQQRSGAGFWAGAEAIAEPDAPAPSRAADVVRLMSVHAAKGLEFEVVCLADLGRAPSMGVPDLLIDGQRLGLRLVDLADGQARVALDYAELARERREAQALEEQRIVYVALTRARERLILSGATDFASWPRDRPGGAPIAWLAPALAPEIPTLCRAALGGPPAPAGEVLVRSQMLAVGDTGATLACTLTSARAGSLATPSPTA